jgi:hypothetical protein
MRALISIVAAIILLPVAAVAQESRYEPYDAPQTQASDEVQELIQELNKLIDEADRARAADPRFLRDLRDLANRFDRPWKVTVLHDEFRDGDITNDPAWTVKAGEYTIDWRDGLRSRIEPAPETQAQSSDTSQSEEKQDVGKALLGSILREVLKDPDENKSQPQQQAAAPRTTHTQIYTVVQITNAFSIHLELSSYEKRGRFAFGPYQGDQQAAGYSLAYNPGKSPVLELQRISSRGTALVDSVPNDLNLEDGNRHFIEWTRDRNGRMIIAVDGTELIDVTDRGFRDPFDGITMVNFEGDFAVRAIEVSGVTP